MTSTTGSVTMAADSSTQKGEKWTSSLSQDGPWRGPETASQRRATKRKKVLQERRARKLKRIQAKKAKGTDKGRSHHRDDSASDCDSDLDLRKDLKPIGQYVHHREEMLEHLFRSISTKKLRAMLPECCKTLNLDELKGLCLEQLDVMSRKRILRILDGADPDVISSTDTEEDSSDPEPEEEEEDPVEEEEEEDPGEEEVEEEEEHQLAVEAEGSAGDESHHSDVTADGSQSQYIDSTSLHEDKYSGCSGAASLRSVSSTQDNGSVSGVEGDQEEEEESPETQEEGEEIMEQEVEEEVQDGAEEEQVDTEATVEEEEELTNVPEERDQEEPEEGEVDEKREDGEEEQERDTVVKDEGEEEPKEEKEEEEEESDELQLEVTEAEIEGLCATAPGSPEEGEVIDDPPEPAVLPPKGRHKKSKSASSKPSQTKGARSHESVPAKTEKKEKKEQLATPKTVKHSALTKRSSAKTKEGDLNEQPPRIKDVKPSTSAPTKISSTQVKKQLLVDQTSQCQEFAPTGAVPTKRASTDKKAKHGQQPSTASPKEATSREVKKGKISSKSSDDVGKISEKGKQVPLTKPADLATPTKAAPERPAVEVPPKAKVKPGVKIKRTQVTDQGVKTAEPTKPPVVQPPSSTTAKDVSKATTSTASKTKGVPTKSLGVKLTRPMAPRAPTLAPAPAPALAPAPTAPAPTAQTQRASGPTAPTQRAPSQRAQASGSRTVVSKQPAVRSLEGLVPTPSTGEPPKKKISLSRRHVVGPTTTPAAATASETPAKEQSTRVVVCETQSAVLPSDATTHRRVQLKSVPTDDLGALFAGPDEVASRKVVRTTQARKTLIKRPYSAAPATEEKHPAVPVKRASFPPSAATPSGSAPGAAPGGAVQKRKVVRRSGPPAPAPGGSKSTGGQAKPAAAAAAGGEAMLSENQMEILELEMRARAIKAMLNSKK